MSQSPPKRSFTPRIFQKGPILWGTEKIDVSAPVSPDVPGSSKLNAASKAIDGPKLEERGESPSALAAADERLSTQLPPIDSTKREGRPTLFMSISSILSRDTPHYLPTVFSVFLGMNVLATYNFMFSLFIPGNRGFLHQIFSEESDIAWQTNFGVYCRYLGPWTAVFFAYMANSYLGEKLMLIVSMILGFLNPVCNLMAVISSGARTKQMFARLAPVCGIFHYGTEVFRNCLILEQLKYPDQERWIPFYVFWFSYTNFVGLIVGKFTMDLCYHVPAVVKIHCYFCLFLSLLHLMVVIKMNDKIVSIKPHKRVIERNIMVAMPFVLTCGREELDLTRGQSRFWSLALILTTFFTFGLGYETVRTTTYSVQAPLLRFEKLNEHLDGFFWYLIITIVVLPFGEFAILPLLETIKLVRTNFQRLGLSYIYLLLAIICCFVLETKLRGAVETLSTGSSSQLRVYNVLPTTVTMTTNLTRNAQIIEPYFKLDLLGIDVYRGSRAIGINISIADPPLNKSYAIILKGGNSYSCIVNAKGLYAVKEVDPIASNPLEEHIVTTARVFVISAIANLTGTITFSQLDTRINVTFPNTKDTSVSEIPPNIYQIDFYKEEAAYKLSDKAMFHQGGIYTIIIHEEKNGRLNMTYYDIVVRAEIHPAWTSVQLALLALGETRTRVSGVSLLLADAPPSVRIFLMVYEYALTGNGLGIHFFVPMRYSRQTTFLGVAGAVTLVGLVFFIYLTLQYRKYD